MKRFLGRCFFSIVFLLAVSIGYSMGMGGDEFFFKPSNQQQYLFGQQQQSTQQMAQQFDQSQENLPQELQFLQPSQDTYQQQRHQQLYQQQQRPPQPYRQQQRVAEPPLQGQLFELTPSSDQEITDDELVEFERRRGETQGKAFPVKLREAISLLDKAAVELKSERLDATKNKYNVGVIRFIESHVSGDGKKFKNDDSADKVVLRIIYPLITYTRSVLLNGINSTIQSVEEGDQGLVSPQLEAVFIAVIKNLLLALHANRQLFEYKATTALGSVFARFSSIVKNLWWNKGDLKDTYAKLGKAPKGLWTGFGLNTTLKYKFAYRFLENLSTVMRQVQSFIDAENVMQPFKVVQIDENKEKVARLKIMLEEYKKMFFFMHTAIRHKYHLGIHKSSQPVNVLD